MSLHFGEISRALDPYVCTYHSSCFIHSHFHSKSCIICSVNIVFATLLTVWFPGHQQPTHDDCMTWVIYKIIACNIMLFILELILRFVSLSASYLLLLIFFLSIRGLPFVATLFSFFNFQYLSVFALYDQSLKIGMFLLTMLIGRMVGSISM